MRYLQRFKDVFLNLAVVAVYLLLARIGLFFALQNPIITIFWPAGGFALAVLLLGGLKFLPGVFAGGVAAGFIATDISWVAGMLGVADTLESWFAYWLLTRRFDFNPALETRQDFFKLTLTVGAAACAMSAILGPGAMLAGQAISADQFPATCLRWWMGDVLGIAFITPLVLIWRKLPGKLSGKARAFELLALFAMTFLVGQIVFFDWLQDNDYAPQGIAWIIPLVIWAGLRAGRHSTSIVQLILFIQALWAVIQNAGRSADTLAHGGFVNFWVVGMAHSGFVNFWVFAIVLAVGGMALAIIGFENAKTQKSLRESEDRLRLALSAGNQGWFDVNLKTGAVSVGPEYIRMLGHDPDTFHTSLDEWKSHIHPDDRDAVMAVFQKCLVNGGPETMEYRRRAAGGGWLWISSVGKIAEWDGQRPTRMIGTHTNISERRKIEAMLRFRQFSLDRAQEEVFWLNRDGRIVDANETACLNTGYSREELLTLSVGDIDPVFPMEMWAEHWRDLKRNGSLTFESFYKTSAGNVSPTEVVANFFEYEGEEYNCAFVRDISERKKTEKILQENQERLALATQHNGVGIWDWNPRTMEMVWDDSMFALYQMRREDFSGCIDAWEKSLHPDDLPRFRREANEALADRQSLDTEFRVIWPNGEIHYIKAVAKIFRDGNGEPTRMLGANVDITARKCLEDELKRQARIDFLTGLSNRRYFMEQAEFELHRAVRYGKPLSLLMMDIDFFKRINDSHGHKLGDSVLEKLAEVCRRLLREVDIIGRVGGEEFAILLPETDKDEAAEVAERLRAELAAARTPLPAGGLPVRFTVSIGVTTLASADDNLDILFHLADKALYAAKNAGRNRVCVSLQ